MQPDHSIWVTTTMDGIPLRCQRIVSIDDRTWLCKDDGGRWLLLDDTTVTEVTEGTSIAVLRLLERSPAEAASEINRANCREPDSRVVIAPVRWALTRAVNGQMDYWAALALNWIEWYGNATELATPLETLSRSHWASQSTRHRAKRLAGSH
jgi:hypothetical protein